MTKEELIKSLKEYRENKSKLRLRKRELEKVEKILIKNRHPELEKGITNTYGINKDIRSINNISNKIENAIISNEEKQLQILKQKKDLEKEIEELKSKIEDVKIALKSLKFKERIIIREHYIEGNSYEDIGNRIFWNIFGQTREKETIKKIADRAIEKILKIYEEEK